MPRRSTLTALAFLAVALLALAGWGLGQQERPPALGAPRPRKMPTCLP